MTFEEFIMGAREKGASDLHLTVGAPTVIRVNGTLQDYMPELSDQVVHHTIMSMLQPDQEQQLNDGNDLDFSFELKNGCRQRANVFRQCGRLACTIRLLNSKILTIEQLHLPPIMAELAKKKKGIILVTGATGSGKSTTLAAVIQHINETRADHIITIEDPIEYRYPKGKATIHQREVGRDVKTFSAALRSALREDPDVILIGEIRDYETIGLALTAAETGHLVLGTLHASSAAQTVDRIIDSCPAEVREQVRSQFANSVQGVISQTLVPSADGKTRHACIEIMLGTDAVRNMIRTNKINQMESTILAGAKDGMITQRDALVKLFREGKISRDSCLEFAENKEDMLRTIGG